MTTPARERQSRLEYRRFIQRMAHRDLPRTMVWMGGVIMAFGTVDRLVPPPTPTLQFLGVLAIGAAMAGSAVWLRQPSAPDTASPWVFAILVALFQFWLLYIYVQEPIPSNLTYVVVVATAYGPLTFAWGPYLLTALLTVPAVVYSMTLVELEGAIDWAIGVFAGLVVSGVLLWLRIHLLKELSDAERANALLSTSDALTGLLNRRGLEERLGTLWSDAARREEPISVCFFDVRGLKRANDEHGHDFGDLVITDVATAIRASVRGGDLVARWGGDEFVTVGVGEAVSADSLGARLNARFESDGRALRSDWSGDVTVGVAVGTASSTDFASLLEAADEDMYSRRHLR